MCCACDLVEFSLDRSVCEVEVESASRRTTRPESSSRRTSGAYFQFVRMGVTPRVNLAEKTYLYEK